MSDGGPPDRRRRPAWIETISPDAAEGTFAEAYRGIAGRSGSVAHILACQSLHPQALARHYELYRELMFSRGTLSREERESIAVAVSGINGCHY